MIKQNQPCIYQFGTANLKYPKDIDLQALRPSPARVPGNPFDRREKRESDQRHRCRPKLHMKTKNQREKKMETREKKVMIKARNPKRSCYSRIELHYWPPLVLDFSVQGWPASGVAGGEILTGGSGTSRKRLHRQLNRIFQAVFLFSPSHLWED